jgi:hypothetical protein
VREVFHGVWGGEVGGQEETDRSRGGEEEAGVVMVVAVLFVVFAVVSPSSPLVLPPFPGTRHVDMDPRDRDAET